MPDHRIIRLLLLPCIAAFVLVIGCDPGTDSTITPITDPAFGHRTQTISADTDHVTTERPITITTRCLPLVSGKGRILMDAWCAFEEGRLSFLEPVDTTFSGHGSRDSGNAINYPIEYRANESLEVRWRVSLTAHEGYGFVCTFVIDSLKLDDGRIVWINSDEAKAQAPKGYGYDRYAPTEPSGMGIEP